MVHFLVGKDQFLPEKTQQIYSRLLPALLVSVLNAIILSYFLWNEVPRLRLSVWLSCVLTLTILRLLSFLVFNKSESKDAKPYLWVNLYLAGLFLSGLLWGSAGILIFPKYSISHQIFVAFVLGGMTAGAIASASMLRFGYYLFSIPALLPIIVRFLFMPEEIHVGMGIMSFIFLVYCLLISRNFHLRSVELLKIRHQNEQEIERRRKSEKVLIQYKDELEETIDDRTKDLKRTNEELRLEAIERQKTELALQESENKLKNIFNTSIPICITNTDYEIILSNNSYKNIFARNEQSEPSIKCYDSRPGQVCHTDNCPMKRVLSGEKEVLCEPSKTNADSSKQYFIVTAKPLLNSNGQVDGIVECFQDITDRKRLEIERDNLIKELEKTLAEIKTLKGILPICSKCHKIRDDEGYWHQVDQYVTDHTEAEFSHGICKECADELYGGEDWYKEGKKKGKFTS